MSLLSRRSKSTNKAARRRRPLSRPDLELLEDRRLLAPLDFLVTNNTDGGPGSLRQAILNANANPGLDTIDFAIPGAGVHTISPTSALPGITDPVVIDGYTQPGAGPNTLANGDNAVLLIELSGSLAGPDTHGLELQSADSLVRGLVINQFGFFGIALTGAGSTGNRVEGCFLGTNTAGTAAMGNRDGAFFTTGAHDNTLGGTVVAARNVISGNVLGGMGIVDPGSSSNVVQGNYIGTNAEGTAAIPNGRDAVVMFNGARNNLIGGTTADARNILSGNNRDGVRIDDPDTTGNVVQGNYIGTDATGALPVPNQMNGVGIGIRAASPSNTIGGTASGAANVIVSNSFGVELNGSGTTGNLVLGNFIGTNAAGATGLGNAIVGVDIASGASGNTIGGTASGAGNVIVRNIVGVDLHETGTTGNVVQGNFIGTNAAGATGLGNANVGVDIASGASGNTIGGTASGAGNVIGATAVPARTVPA